MKDLLKIMIALVGFFAIALALSAVPANANPPFANVIAKAECVVNETDGVVDVTVLAILEQKEKIGPAPEVGLATVVLEEHIRRQPKFQEVEGSLQEHDFTQTDQSAGTPFPFLTPAEGETVEVHIFEYENICASFGIDPDANAIRAVVEIEVLNSNDKRKAGQIHTGRCISFANPCQ
jgi:hypothetical protein